VIFRASSEGNCHTIFFVVRSVTLIRSLPVSSSTENCKSDEMADTLRCISLARFFKSSDESALFAACGAACTGSCLTAPALAGGLNWSLPPRVPLRVAWQLSGRVRVVVLISLSWLFKAFHGFKANQNPFTRSRSVCDRWSAPWLLLTGLAALSLYLRPWRPQPLAQPGHC
jgi:hypothetical protein